MSTAVPESRYRWVIVAVGALMTCVAIGAMFSLAVFLQPMSEATGWSRAGISTRDDAQLPGHGRRGLRLGRGQRPLRHAHRRADRRGAARPRRWCSPAARPRCWRSSSIYGVLVGLAAGAFFAPMIAAVDRLVRRPIAASRSRWSRPAWAWRR